MLISTNAMLIYKLAAVDGPIGKVKDFLFDEAHWAVRWMVASTGNWLPGRKVLISPISLGEPDWNSRLFPVRMTKGEIESAPGLEADEPVSREYERKYFNQFSWPYYWGGVGIWAGGITPGSLFVRQESARQDTLPPEAGTDVLRSVDEVTGYHIQATDDDVGHVEDFIVDDVSWKLRYIVVDTRNWLPGRKVLVAPDWIESVRWADGMVSVSLSRAEIRESPQFDPTVPINREYETRLYDYYGRPVYWTAP